MSHGPGTSLPAQLCPVPALSHTAAVGEEMSILHHTIDFACLVPCDEPTANTLPSGTGHVGEVAS